MNLSTLLKQPEIVDIIQTPSTIYVLTTKQTTVPMYSDKTIYYIQTNELLASPHLPDILTGSSCKHKQLPFTRKLLYTYDLTQLTPSKKQSFAHKLNGTGGRESLLESIGAKRIGRSVVKAPASAQEQIEAFFEEYNAIWSKQELLMRENSK